MGLDPPEPLVDNLWPGDPNPGAVTDNYRGCIASLSSSLEGVPAAWGERLALEHCRASGLQPATSELGTACHERSTQRPLRWPPSSFIHMLPCEA